MYGIQRRSGTTSPANSKGSKGTIRQRLCNKAGSAYSFLHCRGGWHSFFSGFNKISNLLSMLHDFITNRLVVYANLTIIAIGILLFNYWMFLDGTVINPILSVKDITFKTTKLDYKAKEEVFAGSALCKYRSVPSIVNTYLTDTISLPYPTFNRNIPVGCHKQGEMTSSLAKIPSIATPGTYFLEGVITYQVNPLRTIKVPFRTNKFNVIP